MKKGMGWPIGVVAILVATVASNISVIVLTRDDPSFAVEPDYYRKAVAWDSTQQRVAQSDALHWRLSAHVSAPDGEGVAGSRTLTIDLTDNAGAVVRNATLSGSLLHVARANDVQRVAFTENEAGQYVVTVPMPRDGIWELRLAAQRQTDRFQETVRIDTERDVITPTGP